MHFIDDLPIKSFKCAFFIDFNISLTVCAEICFNLAVPNLNCLLMKSTLYLPMMALLAIMTFSCSSDTIEEDPINQTVLQKAPAPKLIEVEILELINNYRISMDLAPLHNLSIIKSVAFTHTDYMVSINQVSHDNFYKRKTSLVQNADAKKVSENVAYAYSSAQSVVKAWLNSPSHKATIEGDFTDFDISAEKNSEGKWYFTNIFIKR